MTYLYAGALFHPFDEATQFAIGLRAAILLKRDSGRHQCLEDKGYIADHMSKYG